MSHWRRRARAIIDKARDEHPKATGEELRAILRPLYPFGPRENHPYKMWLKEVKIVCGKGPYKKPSKGFGGKSWLECSEED